MEINPLNVLEQRQLDWLPDHFTAVECSDTNTKDIERLCLWIHNNLQGRYCVVNSTNYRSVVFGFEQGHEASYFSLIFPSIK